MSFPRYTIYKDSGVPWQGQVPAHWNVVRLKRLAKFNYGDALGAENRNTEGIVPVFGSNGVVGVHDVPNTSAPCIVVGRKGSHGAVHWSEQAAFAIDTAYFIDDVDGDLRWLFWLLKDCRLDAVSQDTGVPGLSRDDAYSTLVAVPQPDEQRLIADFLDVETAKLDTLVADQEDLLALLEEKRTNTITEVVTRGVRPRPMLVETGLSFLGSVPGHWIVQRLKFMVGGVTVGVVVQPSQYYVDTGVSALRSLNVRPMGFDLSTLVYFDEASHRSLGKSELREGDVVVVRTGKPGVAAPVTAEVAGSNCIDLILIRNGGRFDARFLAFVINSEIGRQPHESPHFS